LYLQEGVIPESVLKNVVNIEAEQAAVHAFELMDKLKFGALAIVDEDGAWLSNISARDLKVWLKNPKMSLTRTPVIDFVKAVRQADLKDRFPFYTCHVGDKLSDVLRRLSKLRVHRLYVVEKGKHGPPIGVVSLKDILRLVLDSPAVDVPSDS
jgi:CBS domain-containing protein